MSVKKFTLTKRNNKYVYVDRNNNILPVKIKANNKSKPYVYFDDDEEIFRLLTEKETEAYEETLDEKYYYDDEIEINDNDSIESDTSSLNESVISSDSKGNNNNKNINLQNNIKENDEIIGERNNSEANNSINNNINLNNDIKENNEIIDERDNSEANNSINNNINQNNDIKENNEIIGERNNSEANNSINNNINEEVNVNNINTNINQNAEQIIRDFGNANQGVNVNNINTNINQNTEQIIRDFANFIEEPNSFKYEADMQDVANSMKLDRSKIFIEQKISGSMFKDAVQYLYNSYSVGYINSNGQPISNNTNKKGLIFTDYSKIDPSKNEIKLNEEADREITLIDKETGIISSIQHSLMNVLLGNGNPRNAFIQFLDKKELKNGNYVYNDKAINSFFNSNFLDKRDMEIVAVDIIRGEDIVAEAETIEFDEDDVEVNVNQYYRDATRNLKKEEVDAHSKNYFVKKVLANKIQERAVKNNESLVDLAGLYKRVDDIHEKRPWYNFFKHPLDHVGEKIWLWKTKNQINNSLIDGTEFKGKMERYMNAPLNSEEETTALSSVKESAKTFSKADSQLYDEQYRDNFIIPEGVNLNEGLLPNEREENIAQEDVVENVPIEDEAMLENAIDTSNRNKDLKDLEIINEEIMEKTN